MKKIFLLSWKKAWIVVVGGFASIILHNLVDAVFGVEEAFFFILVIFVLPLYVAIAVVYSIVYWLKRKGQTSPPEKKKD